MTNTLMTNCTLFDPRAGVLATGSSLRVIDGVVTEVSDQPIAPNGAEVLDMAGRTILPGLIDCHVHVNAVRVSSGLAASRVLPPSFIAAAAANIMRGMLLRGFTSVRDAEGADRGLRERWSKTCSSGRGCSCRAVRSARPADTAISASGSILGSHIRKAPRHEQEEQLGALGLTLNAIALWNSTYIQAAIDQLTHEGGDHQGSIRKCGVVTVARSTLRQNSAA